MKDELKVGDVVRFIMDGENDVYTYEIPSLGAVGIVEVQTYSFGLEQALGVKIPMSLVKWIDGSKVPVFSHDLRKIRASQKLIETIKQTQLSTGKNNN